MNNNIHEFHDLWLVGSNLVFFIASLMGRRHRQPIVMWAAFMVGTFSTLYHGSACIWPSGSEVRMVLNRLDWVGCAIAITAAGHYVGWRLMGLLPKIITIATIAFTLLWFAYSMSGDFELYTEMHSVFHILASLPMMFLSYQGHVLRRIQKNPSVSNVDMSFWTAVHVVETRTSRDILHLTVLYIYLRRKNKIFLRSQIKKLFP